MLLAAAEEAFAGIADGDLAVLRDLLQRVVAGAEDEVTTGADPAPACERPPRGR